MSNIGDNPQKVCEYPVNKIEAYERDDTIIVSVHNKNESTIIRDMLSVKGYKEIYYLDNNYCLIKYKARVSEDEFRI